MTSYDKPSIIISVITDVKNSIRQVAIAKWLNYETSSSDFIRRIMIEILQTDFGVRRN